jgi:ribosomal protein S18 acetylase RimI-like enzyme
MSHSDIDFALLLTLMEGWSDISTDFTRVISFVPTAAFVGELGGRPISMISAISYGRIGFIGSLIVLPDFRNRGYGTRLMVFAIDYLESKGSDVVMLDAVQRAVPVYERLGFRQVCLSRRFRGNPDSVTAREASPIKKKQLQAILDLDTQSFSGDRSHFLAGLWQEPGNICLVLEGEEDISGYSFASIRRESVRLGPLYVKEEHVAEKLVRETAAKCPGRELRLGVLDANSKAVELMRRMRFEESQSSVRMLRGERELVVLSDHLYAIGSPAKG